MSKNLLLLVFTISLPLIWISCSNENEIPDPSLRIPAVDAELFEFLEAFEAEAAARSEALPLERFQMTFVSDLGEFCGYGWWDYDGQGTRRVEIENTERCWQGYSEDQKEQLMYHEFGHALLSRRHIESIFPNGQPRSLMCGECDQTRIYYHPNMKEYYLDELFDSRTDFPDWVTNDNFIRSTYDEDFESNTHEWENFIYGDDDNQSGWEVASGHESD